MMLDVDGLTRRYGSETAVDDVSFGIDAGDLVALLGPSGCGKTTVVQAIAGHVRPTAGTVRLRGEDVTTRSPEARRVSVVFQRPTLYPHMTVGENVAYGLEARGVGPRQRDDLVAEYLALVSLDGRRDAYPTELSGGQKRRVELARALAPQPDILLLDEPLSALDRRLRDRLRDEIARIHEETGVTTLFVTHDQDDAMAVADRILVMNDGAIVGDGPPRTLYESPPNPFVASFLGRANTFAARVAPADHPTIEVGDQELAVDGRGPDVPDASEVTCFVRPEHLSIRDAGDPAMAPALRGDVRRVADVGRRYESTVRVDGDVELVVAHAANPPAVGDAVAVEFQPERLTLFPRDDARE